MGGISRRAMMGGVSSTALLAIVGAKELLPLTDMAVAQGPVFDPIPEPPFAIRDRAYKYVSNGTLFIEAIELSLTSRFVRKDLNLVVLADLLRIDETIQLPGKNVIIVAREITSLPGVRIDTSGIKGARFSYGERASAGTGPNLHAADGLTGDTGSPAGDILVIAEKAAGLTLIANGGPGGSGQSGGNGYNGNDGRPSYAHGSYVDYPTNSSQCRRGEPGGDGEDGSLPGDPGAGGNGGNGGHIQLKVADPGARASIGAQAGAAGSPGLPGGGGRGGSRGIGGESWVYEDYNHADCKYGNGDCYGSCNRLDNEPDGKSGYTWTNPTVPVPAKAGLAFPYSFLTGPTAADAARVATLSFADLIVSRAELDYIGGDLQSAATRLAWINAISREAANVQSAKSESWLAKDYHTSVLITQMRHCLNYFGADLTWVPPLKTEAFDNTLNLHFASLEALERDSNSLDSYEGKIDEFNQRIGNAVAGARIQIAEMEQQIESSSANQEETWQEIERLSALASLLGNQVDRANASFKAAVARKSQQSGGCGLFDQIQKAGALLTAVKVATTLVGGGLPTFALVSQTLASFRPPDHATFLDQMISVSQAITGAVDNAQQRITQIQDAWTKVKDAADALQPRQSPPLIKLDRSAYRQTLQEFRDLPEAQELGGLLDRYFDTLDARNQGYANIEAMIAQRNQLRVSIKALQAEAGRLEVIKANANQPGLTEFAAILRRRLVEGKRSVSTLFAQQSRAISYYKAEDVPLPRLEETRVSAMKDIRARLASQFLDAKIDRGRAKQEFEFSIGFDRSSAPEAFGTFATQGHLPFIIANSNEADDQELARWWGIEVKRVVVELATDAISASDPPRLRATLVHMGSTSVKGRDGKFRSFTHKRRATNINFSKSAGGTGYRTSDSGAPVGGDEEFIYPSPYGAWRLSIFEPDLKLFDRSRISGMTIRFIADGISTGEKRPLS